jgi:SAM-dependent methyltransferase
VAHELLHAVVREIVERVDLPEPIVEFGSLQVEPDQPNDLRPLFAGRDFTGTDMRPGPGVDRVEDLLELSFADGAVGTALCLDTLEHCTDPLRAARELRRVVSPQGGVCLITSVMLMGIHGYPNDYWRFTPEGLRLLFEGYDAADVAGMGDPGAPFWVFGIGVRGRELPLQLTELPALRRAQEDYDRAEGRVRIGPFRLGLRELGSELRSQLPRAIRERAGARLAGRG